MSRKRKMRCTELDLPNGGTALVRGRGPLTKEAQDAFVDIAEAAIRLVREREAEVDDLYADLGGEG